MKPARLRLLVGAAGALLCMGYYYAKSVRFPRRTPLGVETRLFGRGNVDLRLRESPEGGRWFVVPGDRPPLSGQPGTLESFLSAAREWRWPTHADVPRRLQLFRPAGTWWLGGDGLTRAWRLPALGWLDEETLWTKKGGPYSPGVEATLDLKTGRTELGDNLIPSETLWNTNEYGEEMVYDLYEEDPSPGSVGESALEELSPQLGEESVSFKRGDRNIHLAYSVWKKGQPRVLYALLDEETPRPLRLTDNAVPLALSQDARTLFFTRNTALWKLEFRKPLPELLEEAPYPTLPEFPTSVP